MKLPQNRDYPAFWVQFVKKGSQAALSMIYLDHYDLLFNYGLKYTKEISLIEDSIQNVFSYFLKVRKSLSPVHNLTGYLLKTLRRQLFHDLKEQKKLLLVEQLPEDNFHYYKSPEEEISDQEEQDQIQLLVKKCISSLTVKQQEMIYLRYECGLSYGDISDILDITVESCHKTIYRSIIAIRVEVEKIYDKRGNIFFLARR